MLRWIKFYYFTTIFIYIFVFGTCVHDSKWLAISIGQRMRWECFECSRYISRLRLPFDSFVSWSLDNYLSSSQILGWGLGVWGEVRKRFVESDMASRGSRSTVHVICLHFSPSGGAPPYPPLIVLFVGCVKGPIYRPSTYFGIIYYRCRCNIHLLIRSILVLI